MLANPRRDATALTIVAVHIRRGGVSPPGSLPPLGGDERGGPTYRVVDRHLWLGVRHTALHARILALARHWGAVWVVVDATGIGAGLASFLCAALGDARDGGRVIPVTFSLKVKSDLGWDFLGIVETGRYADYADDGEPDTRQFWHEVERCQYHIQDGPGKIIRWGNPDPVAYDGLIAHGHDDLLVSAALCAVLDRQHWPATGPSAVVELPDELAEIDATGW